MPRKYSELTRKDAMRLLRYMSPDRVAETLNVSVRTIRRWRSEDEVVLPEWMSGELKPKHDVQLRRAKDSGGRYYYAEIAGQRCLFMGVTTLTSSVYATPEALQKWKADLGWAAAKEESEEKADRGTILHMALPSIYYEQRDNGYVDDSLWPERLHDYVMEVFPDRGEEFYLKYQREWLKGMYAWCQFCFDYEVEVIGVEIPGFSLSHLIGGTMDYVIRMNDKLYTKKTPKNKRKRVVALLDAKSKNIWELHGVQLMCYKEIFQEMFPDIKIEKICNWAPNDWKKSPTYKLKDWTGKVDEEEFMHRVSIARIQMSKKAWPSRQVPGGKFILGKQKPKIRFKPW